MAQYKEDVVRIVIDLESEHDYTVTRDEGEVRVAIMGGAATFTAWHASVPEVAAAEPVVEPRVEPKPTRDLAPVAKQQSQQPRITVTYNDADIRDVLAAFAAFSGRTIVVGKGVAVEVLEPIGYGEERPIDESGTRKGRAKNRRVEFKVTTGAPAPAERPSSTLLP